MHDSKAEYALGMSHLERGDLGPALKSLRAVIGALPGSEQVRRALRQLANAAATRALALPPDSTEASELYLLAIDAYVATGETISDASDHRLLRMVCFNLAASHHRRELYDAAIGYYRDALAFGPDHEDTVGNLADLLISQKQAKDAVDILEPALSRHPESVNLLIRMIVALQMAGYREQAAAVSARAIGPIPGLKFQYANRFYIYDKASGTFVA